MKSTLIIMMAALLAATGCVSTVAKTTRKTYPDGTVSLASYVSVKGTGDKAATLAAEGLFADGNVDDLGAGVRNASATQESSGVADTLRGVGELLTGVGAAFAPIIAAQRVPVGGSSVESSVDVDTDYSFAGSTTDGSTAYSDDGYAGVPGPNGEGVYGRPTCGNCRRYRVAHPDVEIINIDNQTYRKAMWDALRARGFRGDSVTTPVLITESAYQINAK